MTLGASFFAIILATVVAAWLVEGSEFLALSRSGKKNIWESA
jgi:hypothetical protein